MATAPCVEIEFAMEWSFSVQPILLTVKLAKVYCAGGNVRRLLRFLRIGRATTGADNRPIMEFQDYYETMGVDRDATAADIKRAYRGLARKYHPDVSKEANAEEQFKKVGEAYAVLKDPEKRVAYDQLGENWQAGQDFKAPPGWDAGFEFQGRGSNSGSDFDSSDFFSTLFGHGFQQRSNQSGNAYSQDHHAKVIIDLEDAWLGRQRKITLRMPEMDASGQLSLKERVIDVKIPSGIRHGQQIRLRGLGAPASGSGQAGDLYLEVEFAPHPVYRVDGPDLYVDLPVAPWEAVLGGKVKLQTPAGPVALTIPAGSSGGRKLRVKARGMPGSTPGDLYVTLVIALPGADTEKARKIYENMREELDFDPRADLVT